MKRYILSIVAVLSVFGLIAQEKPNDEAPKAVVKVIYPPMMEQNKFLSLSAGGGISTLMYDFPYGSSEWGKGGRFNIDYNIFFSRVCGISFGIGGSKYNSTVTFDDNSKYTTNISVPVMDYYGKKTTYDGKCTTTFNGWKETQSVFALEVPVGVLFRAPLGKKATFLAGVGAKLSFPINSSYEVTDGTATTTVDVKNPLNVHYDSIPSQGITTSATHSSGESETKLISASGYLDLNLVHRVGRIHLFYGLYADYGLTSISKKEKTLKNNVEYN